MNLTNETRTEIKQQLESSDSFKYWNQEIGLKFEDFDILDSNLNIKLHEGNKNIGNYKIFLKEGVINSVYYDFDNESVTNHNLEKIV